jgi:hypothetical protein
VLQPPEQPPEHPPEHPPVQPLPQDPVQLVLQPPVQLVQPVLHPPEQVPTQVLPQPSYAVLSQPVEQEPSHEPSQVIPQLLRQLSLLIKEHASNSADPAIASPRTGSDFWAAFLKNCRRDSSSSFLSFICVRCLDSCFSLVSVDLLSFAKQYHAHGSNPTAKLQLIFRLCKKKVCFYVILCIFLRFFLQICNFFCNFAASFDKSQFRGVSKFIV